MRWSCLLLVLALAGCTGAAPEEPGTVLVPRTASPAAPTAEDEPVRGNVSFDTLVQGTKSGVSRDGMHMEVVFDDEAWAELWSEHEPGTDPPQVDFGSSFVVAVFMGDQDSTGHRIEVTAVRADGNGVRVETLGTSPEADCVIGPATQPHHFVRVAREGLDPLDVRSGQAVWKTYGCA